MPDLLPALPPLGDLVPSLLQAAVVSGGGASAGGGAAAGVGGVTGGTTAVVTTPVTTVPAMMAMAPMLPAVALGIVKAIFISKLRDVRFT